MSEASVDPQKALERCEVLLDSLMEAYKAGRQKKWQEKYDKTISKKTWRLFFKRKPRYTEKEARREADDYVQWSYNPLSLRLRLDPLIDIHKILTGAIQSGADSVLLSDDHLSVLGY